MAAHKEGKIETYFKEQVEAHGGITRKAKWLCRRGCPDQFWSFPVIHYKNPDPLAGEPYREAACGFAEIKAPGQPLQAHQDREIGKLKSAGVTVYVIDSREAVDAFIRREA